MVLAEQQRAQRVASARLKIGSSRPAPIPRRNEDNLGLRPVPRRPSSRAVNRRPLDSRNGGRIRHSGQRAILESYSRGTTAAFPERRSKGRRVNSLSLFLGVPAIFFGARVSRPDPQPSAI